MKFGANGEIRKLVIHLKKSENICDSKSSSIENELKSTCFERREFKKNRVPVLHLRLNKRRTNDTRIRTTP